MATQIRVHSKRVSTKCRNSGFQKYGVEHISRTSEIISILAKNEFDTLANVSNISF